jgi:hypothetical protein
MVYPGIELFRAGKKLSSILEAPGVQAGNATSTNYYQL